MIESPFISGAQRADAKKAAAARCASSGPEYSPRHVKRYIVVFLPGTSSPLLPPYSDALRRRIPDAGPAGSPAAENEVSVHQTKSNWQ